jgi:predicted nucleic acid-binding protein
VLLADVNVFLYAHRPESARHPDYLTWLQQALLGPEPFGVSEAVLASFVRIATHHRVYVEPSPSDIALAFCDAVRSASATVVVQPVENELREQAPVVLAGLHDHGGRCAADGIAECERDVGR